MYAWISSNCSSASNVNIKLCFLIHRLIGVNSNYNYAFVMFMSDAKISWFRTFLQSLILLHEGMVVKSFLIKWWQDVAYTEVLKAV